MAIATGSAVIVLNDAPAALTAATVAIADGGFSDSADKLSVVQATNVNGCKLCRIEVRATFSGAGAMVTSPAVYVWARLKSRDGTSWEAVPDANNKRHLIAILQVDPDNITTEQILVAEDCPVPVEVDFELWLENASGVGIALGWDHEMQAYTYKEAA